MSGKHNVNLSISAGGGGGGGGVESPIKFSKNEGGGLDMITSFRWGWLVKIGVRFFMGGGAVFT